MQKPVLSALQHEQAATSLHSAERNRKQVQQLALQHPEMNVADAYAVQEAWHRLKVAEGRVVQGRKVGITSQAMREALKINDCDLGTLYDDMLYLDGAKIPFNRFIEPKIEVELAFVLKTSLSGSNVNYLDVLDATDYVLPALEILDARTHRLDPETGRMRTVLDTIADNAANAAFVIGGERRRPDEIDMRWVGSICSRNGEVVETGLAAGVLNHPAHGIAWLARALHARGASLEPGIVLLSGSFIRPVSVRKGDTFCCDFHELGTVSCHFSESCDQ